MENRVGITGNPLNWDGHVVWGLNGFVFGKKGRQNSFRLRKKSNFAIKTYLIGKTTIYKTKALD